MGRKAAASGETKSTAALTAEQKALANALGQIEKTFGTGSIMKLGESGITEIEGISSGSLSLDLALNEKLIEKSGSWFNYGDIRLGQGREKVKEYLEENKDLFAELRQLILDRNAVEPFTPDPAEAAEDEAPE